METKTKKETNPRKRLKVWDDILEHHNMTAESFADWCKDLRPHEVGNRKEEMVVAAYNGRQLQDPPAPDFNDGTWKYYPIFDHSGGGFRFFYAAYWLSVSSVGARLLYVGPEAEENLCDAVKKFLPEYKESRTL